MHTCLSEVLTSNQRLGIRLPVTYALGRRFKIRGNNHCVQRVSLILAVERGEVFRGDFRLKSSEISRRHVNGINCALILQ